MRTKRKNKSNHQEKTKNKNKRLNYISKSKIFGKLLIFFYITTKLAKSVGSGIILRKNPILPILCFPLYFTVASKILLSTNSLVNEHIAYFPREFRIQWITMRWELKENSKKSVLARINLPNVSESTDMIGTWELVPVPQRTYQQTGNGHKQFQEELGRTQLA